MLCAVVPGDDFSGGSGPYIDGIPLNVLAVVEPLHGECAVEADGLGEFVCSIHS